MIPLTWQGFLLLIGSGLVVYYLGVMSEDWVLLVVGMFGVVMPILSAITVGIAALWTRHQLKSLNAIPNKRALQTDTAHPVLTDFRLPRFTMPFLDFLPTWETPDASVEDLILSAERTEQVAFERRGFHNAIVRRFYLSDLFGLAEVRWRMTEERTVEIWPHTHPHQAPFARAFIEGSERFVPNRPRRGDYVDIRAYSPGDPVRLIHWKLFARSNEPFVRTPEPSASFEHQILAYLATDPHDRLAAQAARWDLENGHLGTNWKFGTDGGEQVASDLGTARRLLATSGSKPHKGGAHLESFLQSVDFKPDQNRLLLYVSGHVNYWLPNIMDLLKKHTALVSVIVASEDNIDEDHIFHPSYTAQPVDTPAKKDASWKRMFVTPLPEEAESTPRWWEQLQHLHREGLQIQFIHVPQVSSS